MKPTNKIMISISHKHSEFIFSGEQHFVILKSTPKVAPYIVYMYETKQNGGAGAVVGCFHSQMKLKTNVPETPQGEEYLKYLAERACISLEELKNYANGGEICAIQICQATRYPASLPLSHFGFSRPPQSWRYLE